MLLCGAANSVPLRKEKPQVKKNKPISTRERFRMRRLFRIAYKRNVAALMPYVGKKLTPELIEEMKLAAYFTAKEVMTRYAHLYTTTFRITGAIRVPPL
jgi:hypothetical protein